MFTIELTRGQSWQEPAETIDRRECQTQSIAAAIAEARYWLAQCQGSDPGRGATHYRVVAPDGATVLGGPP